MATRPSDLPDWATGISTPAAPASSLRAAGWISGAIPTSSDFDWFWDRVYRWLYFLSDPIDHTYTWNARSLLNPSGVSDNTQSYSGPYTLVGKSPTATSTPGTVEVPLAALLPAVAQKGAWTLKEAIVGCDCQSATDDVRVTLTREPKDGSAARAAVGSTTEIDNTGGYSRETVSFSHAIDDDYTYLLIIEIETASATLNDCFLHNVSVVITRPPGA